MSKDRTWFLIGKKLAGEASAEELTELEGLLRSDPDMHYALQNITDLWNLSAPANNDAEEAFNRHVNRLKETTDWDLPVDAPEPEPDYTYTTTHKRSRKKLLIVSIAAAVLMAGSIYWYHTVTKRAVSARPFPVAKTDDKNEMSTPNVVSTSNGNKSTINLPDGSKVWLNAGSTLSYKNFGGEMREVELSGEAFFEVKPVTMPGTNQRVPFIIHTHFIDVRVLGTAFNVKAYPKDKQTITSLVHGKVEVLVHNNPGTKYTLQPNQKLVVKNEEVQDAAASLGELTHDKDDTTLIETAWVQNKLIFDNEPFTDIAEKLERWYNVEIVFRDAKLKTERMSGNFSTETIQQALEAMSVTTPYHYTMHGNKITIRR